MPGLSKIRLVPLVDEADGSGSGEDELGVGTLAVEDEGSKVLPGRRGRFGFGQGKMSRWLSIMLVVILVSAFVHLINVAHSSYEGATTGPCTSFIHNFDYTKVLPLKAQKQEIEAIQFSDALTAGQPSALVQVLDSDSPQRLDMYVYGCMIQYDKQQQARSALTLLFKAQGLPEGQATISEANTLMVGEQDTTLAGETASLMLPVQQNIYREYRWHDGQFVQTRFPGLYPVTSRGEAEALQDQANEEMPGEAQRQDDAAGGNGKDQGWRDPMTTAQTMAMDVLGWQANAFTCYKKDGTDEVTHVVLRREEPKTELVVTLRRLVEKDSRGLWFVTEAQSPGMSLEAFPEGGSLASPLAFRGMTNMGSLQFGAQVFDHALRPLRQWSRPPVYVHGNGAFSGKVYFTNNVANQPGVLVVEQVGRVGKEERRQVAVSGMILG